MKTVKELIATAKLLDLPWYEKVLIPLIIKHKSKYKKVESLTGVPAGFLAAIHVRENGSDIGKFKTYLGNGQPLDKVTTIVPKKRGPFKDWVSGAVDALGLHELEKIKDWDLEKTCYEWERYNGFGYKGRGKNSPYVWSGTQHGVGVGYFTKDGHYSATAKDENIGCFALYKLLSEKDADFKIKNDIKPVVENTKKTFFDLVLEFLDNFFKSMPSEISLVDRIVSQNPNIDKTGLSKALRFLDKAIKKEFMLFVDFNLHSSKERAFLIDLNTGITILSEQTTVGKYSDPDHNGIADVFSNVSGSGKSSLGAMLTGKEYGKSVKGWSKFNEAAKLHGLEPGLNDKVSERAIVIHDSQYAETGGRSLGCITFNPKSAALVIDKLGEGSLVYCYHKSII